MEIWIITARCIATFCLALLFGLERQRSHKPIGFGTFIFVSMGSCALAISAVALNPENPLPLLAGIVTSIGFLGAGALIRTTDKIFGFTTAASIWVFAIIGLLMGLGEYTLTMMVYSAIWAVIGIDRILETRGIGSYQRKLVIVTNKIIPDKDIRNILLLNTSQNKLISVKVDKGENTMEFHYIIEGAKKQINSIPDRLYKEQWLASCKLE